MDRFTVVYKAAEQARAEVGSVRAPQALREGPLNSGRNHQPDRLFHGLAHQPGLAQLALTLLGLLGEDVVRQRMAALDMTFGGQFEALFGSTMRLEFWHGATLLASVRAHSATAQPIEFLNTLSGKSSSGRYSNALASITPV